MTAREEELEKVIRDCLKELDRSQRPSYAWQLRAKAVLLSTPKPEATTCPTCNGTGKEGRHSICRDCDEAPPEATEDWQLVPKIPTVFMIDAAIGCDWRRGDETIQNIWRSMLAVAPDPLEAAGMEIVIRQKESTP